MKRNFYTVCALLWSVGAAYAQHNYELYNNGAVLYTASSSDMYVLGDVHMAGASDWQHNGFIEVQGNMYSSNTFTQKGTGTVRLHNRTVNTAQSQFIQGSYAVRGGQSQIGTANDGSFYNLELANSQGIVWLSGTGNVADVRNSVDFDPSSLTTPTNRIITHDPAALPTNGSGYSAIFGLMNTTGGLGSLVNNTVTTNGNMSSVDAGYIQGKFRRAINAAGGTYNFVLGLEPAGVTAKRGVQYTLLQFAANTYDVLTGYFQSASPNTVSGSPIECHGYLIDYFGGADHGEWIFTPSTAGTGTYTMQVWPQDHTMPNETVWLITKDNAIAGTADQCGATTIGLQRGGFSGFSEFGVAGATIILDVKFLNIQARPIENRYIRVDWTTAEENNVSHFEIERSTDGVNFQYLTTHSAAGNSTTPRAYLVDDYNVLPNQYYYYRVKAVDVDGTFDYTNAVVASLEDKNAASEEVTIFPNPSLGSHTTLSISSIKNRDANIMIYDMLGRIIYTQSVVIQQGINLYELPIGELAPATYIVKIIGSDFANVQEFIKARN